ncbi:LysR family transcriptional regulator [Tropicimonas sediminicola]|uniref:DNA-binding transcriptional regulator, LysR family n=1 Tax=Tropicimonas sediminicola TaxID=1031541 RepID=A0A239IE05_9RHOB|nr:LysR family transcriptional regulator [Tropicimonas sediminicola]SNS91253.1 DNA-binding transcriptional regulator, LysR family [Tropicimonas sediminicola]
MDDLGPIRVFLEVARQSSFTGAARVLGTTPASVTRAVARLEEALGQQLLLRTTRRVSTTSAGAMIAARYTGLLEEFDAATEQIRQESLPDRGQLRLNAPMSLGLRLMPGLVESFRLAYPHVQLQIRLTDRLIDIMEEPCDVAIRISQAPADKSTIWRKICEVPRHVVAAPALFERVSRPQTPDEIDRFSCLSYGDTSEPETWTFQKDRSRRQVQARGDVISNNGDLLYELVLKGGGMALLPDFITSEGVASGAVETVLDDWPVPMLWLTLFYPPYEKLPPLVATFTDFFEVYLEENASGAFRWS